VGADGYPQRIWNKRTGNIDHRVAAYWKAHFDLRHYLATHWATLGPELVGKLHIYVGDMDTYYLNMGVRMMDAFLKQTKHPKADATVVFQPMAPHCWGPRGGDLINRIVTYMDGHAPAGADLGAWRY
jgi:hypothetical protein